MISISAAEVKKQKNAYQLFFSSLLEKWGIKSPFKLDKEKMKQFFTEVKEGWAAEKAMTPVTASYESSSAAGYSWYIYTDKKPSLFEKDSHDLSIEKGEKFGIRMMGDKILLVHDDAQKIKFYITKQQCDALLKKAKHEAVVSKPKEEATKQKEYLQIKRLPNEFNLDSFLKKICPIVDNLASRWADESEYEDFDTYQNVVKKVLPKEVSFVSMTKKPFGFKFKVDDKSYALVCSKNDITLKEY